MDTAPYTYSLETAAKQKRSDQSAVVTLRMGARTAYLHAFPCAGSQVWSGLVGIVFRIVVSLGPYGSYGKLHLPRVTTELIVFAGQVCSIPLRTCRLEARGEACRCLKGPAWPDTRKRPLAHTAAALSKWVSNNSWPVIMCFPGTGTAVRYCNALCVHKRVIHMLSKANTQKYSTGTGTAVRYATVMHCDTACVSMRRSTQAVYGNAHSSCVSQ